MVTIDLVLESQQVYTQGDLKIRRGMLVVFVAWNIYKKNIVGNTLYIFLKDLSS